MERLNRCNTANKPLLTAVHRQKRLAFARANINRDWTRVLFSDEKMIQLDCGEYSAGIWAWISIDGPGEITTINGGLNIEQYIKILDEVLIPSVDIIYHGVGMLFMQDNHSVHSSNLVRNWFNTHLEFELMEWPQRSSDLNPIENVWDELMRGWESVFPRNRKTFESHIFRRWEELKGNKAYFQTLFGSMPDRLQEVINNNGDLTSY